MNTLTSTYLFLLCLVVLVLLFKAIKHHLLGRNLLRAEERYRTWCEEHPGFAKDHPVRQALWKQWQLAYNLYHLGHFTIDTGSAKPNHLQ